MAKRKNQIVKFRTVAEKLPELEGKTLKEVAEILGYTDIETARTVMYKNQRLGKISFDCKGGIYKDFKLLDSVVKSKLSQQEEDLEGKRLMQAFYFNQIIEMDKIIRQTTAKNSDKTKAADLQQKAMRHFTYGEFKKAMDLYEYLEG